MLGSLRNLLTEDSPECQSIDPQRKGEKAVTGISWAGMICGQPDQHWYCLKVKVIHEEGM